MPGSLGDGWEDALILAPLMGIFGEETQANYQPAAGEPFDIDGVFDRAYRDLTILDGDPSFNTVAPVDP